MQLRIPILTTLLVLTTVLAIPLATHTVAATVGLAVDDPANIWVPYGPWGATSSSVKTLQLKFYSSETVEFSAFEQGNLDIVDWELPKSKFHSYDINADFLVTPQQPQFGDFGVYYNGASSTWRAWGCDWAANFDTTVVGGDVAKPAVANPQIYNNTRQVDARGIACDVNMRQGFAHLFDRPRWVVDGILQGTAQALADDSPPAKAPSGSTLKEQCSWDVMFPTCISAFNIANDTGGFAANGSPDFCAAADHMIAARIATGKQPVSCILTGINPAVFLSHPLRFMIRNDKPPRLQFGNGFTDAINRLFGGNAVKPIYGNIRQIGFPIVFSEPPTSPVDDWDVYTYGYGLPGAFPDHYYPFYNSVGATDFCGGPANDFPDSVQFVCNTQVDSATLTAQRTADVPTFVAAITKSMSLLGHIASTLPVYADGVRFAALRSVDGLVNQRGAGYTTPATINYAHKGSYVPLNARYSFGGGDPTTLRWGQASVTQELNVFKAQTVWELNVIGEIYDGLFGISPVQLNHTYCNMCNTVSTIVPFVAGDTLYDVNLRPNLRFHDGTQVTAHDVAFSALNLGKYAANFGGGIRQGLRGVKVISPTEVLIEWQGQSVSWPLNMGFVILPSRLWEDPAAAAPPSCAKGCVWGTSQGAAGDTNLIATDIHPVAAAKAQTTYDPVSQGTLIGSGAFACTSVFATDLGKLGTGCVTNADGSRGGQSVPTGGTVTLQAFDFTNKAGNADPFYQYVRTYNPSWATGSRAAAQSGQLQEWRWAEQGNTGTVTALDFVSVAQCYGATPFISTDTRIKFVDNPPASTPNAPGTWTAGKTAVYDFNNNGVYDACELIIAGTAPPVGTFLSVDTRIKFRDFPQALTPNAPGTWPTGDLVVYDFNNNGAYDAGEPVVAVGAPPVGTFLSIDSKIKFVDNPPASSANAPGTWTAGKTAVYDFNNNGVYDAGEPVVGVGTAPPVGTFLSIDSKIKFVASPPASTPNAPGIWAGPSGRAVVYDTNNFGLIYDAGVIYITGAIGCTQANYNYWHRSAFESEVPRISGEVAIVSSHLDETFISPYWPWDTTQLQNIASEPSVRTTRTEVSCASTSISLGTSTVCTVSVTDNDVVPTTTPGGTVTFYVSGITGGSFSGNPCTLSGAGPTASCQVTFSATNTGTNPTGAAAITAIYNGDPHRASMTSVPTIVNVT